MDNKAQTRKQQRHPKARANFLLHLLFCWELPIFVKGLKEDLDEDNLYKNLKDHKAKSLGSLLEAFWKEEKVCQNPSLLRALLRMFRSKCIAIGFIIFPMEIALLLLPPHCLKRILDTYSARGKIERNEAFVYGGLLVFLYLLFVLIYHWQRLEAATLGMKARIACSFLIYRKTLALNKVTLQDITIGTIISLLSNDVNRLDNFFLYLHYLWIGPVYFIVGVYYLVVILDYTVLPGFVAILICILFQFYLLKRLFVYRKQTAQKTEFRIRLMNDVIYGIRVIKMFAWEKPFEKLVGTARRLEVDNIKWTNHIRITASNLSLWINSLVPLSCLLTVVLIDAPITSQYVFVLVIVFTRLKSLLSMQFTKALLSLTEARVSIQRIQQFLMFDQKKETPLVKSKKKRIPNEIFNGYFYKKRDTNKNFQKQSGIYCHNASVKWNLSSEPILNHVTFNITSGDVMGLIGAPGSGKSTLFQAILRENFLIKGRLHIEGTISYASQEAWIFPASFRQNILFNQEMDQNKYLEILRICGLEHDLSMLPHGDQTLVGERGMKLSGGQRARVNLARALYREADIYLLDDPLSAVDMHLGSKIFHDCILEYLKNKCVVFVTHQLQYMKRCNRIMRLENGTVKLYSNLQSIEALSDSKEKAHEIFDIIGTIPLKVHQPQLEVKEHRNTCNTSKIFYKKYCSASGHWLYTSLVFLFFVLTEFFECLSDYFLTIWVNVEESTDFHLSIEKYLTTENCLYIYASLKLLTVLMLNITIITFSNYAKNVSKFLHNQMLSKILRTTTKFFDDHNSGRILNRFSKDLGYIDEVIPILIMQTLSTLLLVISASIFLCILNYWMIISSVVLFAIIFCYGVVFYPANKNMKRTESITRSSVFTHLSVSMQGLTTIKAFNAEKLLEEEFDNHQNLNTSAYYLSSCLFAALGFWTDLTCSIYAGLAIFSLLLVGDSYSANLGLGVLKAISVVLFAQYGMKLWSELDTHMTSVERVIEYTEIIQEKDDGGHIPPELWPNAGCITFESVSLRYLPDAPLALHQVSFQIYQREKIGIIGRTGAGKSSLISTLLRLFDFEGKIIIDGIDTKSVPFSRLRQGILVIPQEPVLFIGTLRKNLDPFGEFTDLQLWNVLEEVQLKNMVSGLPSGLDSDVAANGSNFSIGQRQLLCLGRAMLRNARILVLDETTSYVDIHTDQVIQSIVRAKFQGCTILTIAHRLDTVMDCDRILVMDDGRAVEFDSPDRLLKDTSSLFYKYSNIK